MSDENPLLDDRHVDFLLYDVFDAPSLCRLPAFADHSHKMYNNATILSTADEHHTSMINGISNLIV